MAIPHFFIWSFFWKSKGKGLGGCPSSQMWTQISLFQLKDAWEQNLNCCFWRRDHINECRCWKFQTNRKSCSFLLTLQLLSYASIPRTLLDENGWSREDVCGVRQKQLQVFVEQSHAAGILHNIYLWVTTSLQVNTKQHKVFWSEHPKRMFDIMETATEWEFIIWFNQRNTFRISWETQLYTT